MFTKVVGEHKKEAVSYKNLKIGMARSAKRNATIPRDIFPIESRTQSLYPNLDEGHH